jgi:phage terminase large subunit-like protein
MPRNASLGKTNAASKADDLSPGPWESWAPSSLPARAIRFMQTYCIPSKGHTAGKPLVLAPWQTDWTEEVLCDGITSSALTLPKGNGKSTFTGAFATWALNDEVAAETFGGKPDVPVVAPTLKQGRKGIYGACVDFRKNHPDIKDRTIEYTASGAERITAPRSGGELYLAADDPDTIQGLDPSIAFIDEIGWVTVETWDSLLLGSGKRPRSLILGLGTRNPENVPNALDHLVAQVAEHGPVEGFVLVDYAADPSCRSDDRQAWRDANPSLAAGFMSEEAIANAQRLSPDSAFRLYRLNIKTGSLNGWLGVDGPEHWDATQGKVAFDPDAPTWLGVDKSAYSDSSAVVALQHLEGMWLAKAEIFIPNPTVDHAAVKDHIRAMCGDFNVCGIGYDDRYFVEGAQELEDEGLPLIKVPQTPARLVGPYVSLYADIVAHNFLHDDDPVFRSHVLGAVAKPDSSGGFTLAKGRSKTKIDAAVAMGIARAVSDVEIEQPPEYTTESFTIH